MPLFHTNALTAVKEHLCTFANSALTQNLVICLTNMNNVILRQLTGTKCLKSTTVKWFREHLGWARPVLQKRPEEQSSSSRQPTSLTPHTWDITLLGISEIWIRNIINGQTVNGKYWCPLTWFLESSLLYSCSPCILCCRFGGSSCLLVGSHKSGCCLGTSCI